MLFIYSFENLLYLILIIIRASKRAKQIRVRGAFAGGWQERLRVDTTALIDKVETQEGAVRGIV